MTREEKLLDFLHSHGVEVRDRRPGGSDPLPYRRSLDSDRRKSRDFAGYRRHDFEADTVGICVHHDAAPQKATGRADQHAASHLKRWQSAGGLAYTAVISPRGVFSLAWDLDLRLYSQGWSDTTDDPRTLGDENILYKGILVEGSMIGPENPPGQDEPTRIQLHVLEIVRAAFWILFGKKEVSGHFRHGKPACPGATLQAWVEAHSAGSSGEPSPLDLDTKVGVQEALQTLQFYFGKIDGIVGPKTRAAIETFQYSHGLLQDGLVGPRTRGALSKALKKMEK